MAGHTPSHTLKDAQTSSLDLLHYYDVARRERGMSAFDYFPSGHERIASSFTPHDLTMRDASGGFAASPRRSGHFTAIVSFRCLLLLFRKSRCSAHAAAR